MSLGGLVLSFYLGARVPSLVFCVFIFVCFDVQRVDGQFFFFF